MKEKIFQEIDKIENQISKLSKDIHGNPELCFQEYKSSGFIKELLIKHGFEIEDKSGDIETAFKGRYKGKGEGPTIAFLAEYDALPGIGHGCGHNVISAISTGAAIALSKVMNGIRGEIILFGTPAEEGGGGKIILIEKGEFDDIDFALMVHPSNKAIIGRGGLATTSLEITYTGISAHSASPEDGVNALQAVIQTFNLIDSTRTQLPMRTNINGIITQGGTAANIIPDKAKCKFSVRARTLVELRIVLNKINNIIKSVEKLTGAKAETTLGKPYAERYPNITIGEVYKKYMELQGEEINYPDPNTKIGSSDIGNVTLKIPAIHAYVKIADDNVISHSLGFTKAAISQRANEAIIKSAKALACTGYEIMTDKKLRQEIDKEFKEKVPVYNSLDLN